MNKEQNYHIRTRIYGTYGEHPQVQLAANDHQYAKVHTDQVEICIYSCRAEKYNHLHVVATCCADTFADKLWIIDEYLKDQKIELDIEIKAAVITGITTTVLKYFVDKTAYEHARRKQAGVFDNA